MSDAKDKKNSEDNASGGGSSKLVMILTIVNLVVVVIVAAFVFISFKKENSTQKITDISPEEEVASAHGAKEGEGHGGGHGEAPKDAHGGGHGGGHGEAPKKKEGSRWVTLEQFTVNLNTPGGTSQRFVRVNISVETENDEVEGEVQAKMPQVRNTIIDLFNSKRPGDLSTGEGRDYLREEIRTSLKSFIMTGKIKGVYFTNFAVTS